jgi:uncharacterized cupredoxin-like copper-binding protein
MRRTAIVTMLTSGLAASTLAFAHGGSGAGEPAKPDAATRTVEVEMFDANGHMGFKPDRVEVARGAVVKFVIHNGGSTTHEFVLGDVAENAAHARMMLQMPDMRHDDPNAKTLDAGASASLAWRFTNAGQFEFACLLPGHYEAGMHGVVVVK